MSTCHGGTDNIEQRPVFSTQNLRPVVIDCRHIKSGIGTYSLQLLEHVPAAAPDLEFLGLVRKSDLARLSQRPNVRYKTVEAGIYGLVEQAVIPVRTRGAGVLHSLHYNVPLLFRGRSVVTIHDLTHLMFPAMLPNRAARLYARAMISQAVRKSDLIVVVSEFVRQQLIGELGVPAAKIRVIYSGLELRAHNEDIESRRPPLDRPYLLYVGNLKQHKNLDRLIRAFAILCSTYGVPHALVLVGAGEQQGLQTTAVAAGVADRVVFAGWVSDSTLEAWYAGADGFVMPSLSEGFGFPALEALSFRIPVAAARATALPEILGDAALFFDPTDVDEISAKLWQLINENDLRSTLRKRAAQCLRRYSWRNAAAQYVELYRELLN